MQGANQDHSQSHGSSHSWRSTLGLGGLGVSLPSTTWSLSQPKGEKKLIGHTKNVFLWYVPYHLLSFIIYLANMFPVDTNIFSKDHRLNGKMSVF